MNPIERLQENLGTRSVVQDAVHFVLDSFSQRLDDMELEKLEAPMATELAMAKLQVLVDLATMQYDGYLFPDEPFEKMIPDGEPYPEKIDSWARGIVTTRKVVVEDKTFTKGAMSARSGTASVSSYRSSTTGRTRNTSASRSTRSHGSRGGDKTVDDKTGQIVDLDDPDKIFGDFNSTDLLFDQLQRAKRKKEKGYIPGSAGEDDAKGEFELLEEQLSKTAKDLRGKKFILDRYGQPIILSAVDASRLPALLSSPELQVKDAALGNASGRKPSNQQTPRGGLYGAANAMQQQQQQQQGQKKRQFVRVAGSRGVDEASFQPTLSLATSLSGLENIPKVHPGVTVRSVVGSKAGEVVSEDPKHISRRTLLAKSQQLQQQQSLHSPSSQASLRTQQTRGTAAGPMQVGFQDSAAMDSVDVAASIASLPDFNPLEGSRRMHAEDGSHDFSDAELGLGPYNAGAARSPPGRKPQKPSDRQDLNIRLLRGSPDLGKPKDRDQPRNIHPVAQRKHLPAPPLGQTTGHGLSLERYQKHLQDRSQTTETFAGDSMISGSRSPDDWHQQWRS